MRRIVFFCALLLACSANAQNAMSEAERQQFADGLLARGMYDLAIKEYDSLLKDYPATTKADSAHYNIAECHRLMADRAAAETEYKNVFANYPDSPLRFKAGCRLADMAAEAGKTEAALGLYGEVLKGNPPDSIAATCEYFSGEMLLKLGRRDEAVKYFDTVRTKRAGESHYSYALLKLGSIYGEDPARMQEALDLYKAAADKPASERIGAEALFQTAELYFRNKDFKKSAEAYKDLLKAYPADDRSSESSLQAAWASHNAGLYSDALATAVEALKVESGGKKTEWMYLKANCERQLLKTEDAIKTYSEILQQWPDSPFASSSLYEKALTYYKSGSFKETVAEASKIRTTPENGKDVYWLLAESYSELKDAPSAIQYYRLIVKEYPKSDVACDATYRLAHLLQSKGEFKEAASYYSAAAANFPKSKLAPAALYASGICLSKINMYEGAIRDWASLIQAYPEDVLVEDAMYQKGLSETRIKRDKEASGTFGELVKKFPKSKFAADSHYWLGMLLRSEGKFKDAEDELRSALQSEPGKELQREIQLQLAAVLQKNGKLDEAAGLFQGLLDSPLQEKLSPSLLQWLAEYKSSQKAHKESMDAATRLIERSQDAVWQQAGWCLVGRGAVGLGDLAKAEEAFKKCLAIKGVSRFSGEAAFQLGELLLKGQKYEEAAACFKQAAEQASDESQLGVRARAYVGMAKAAKGRGDHANATRYFLSVPILYDDPEIAPECLYEAAQGLMQQNKKDEAAKVSKELKDRYPDSAWAKKIDNP